MVLIFCERSHEKVVARFSDLALDNMQLAQLTRRKSLGSVFLTPMIRTEIDFAELGERKRHRLFVGMSRARQALKPAVSDTCAQVLAAEIAQ